MSEIKMLPLPEWMSTFIVPDEGKEVGCDHRLSALMKDYARANVAHATAAQAAEIEALRVELDRLRGEHVRVRWDRNAAEARAEKLAEALRVNEGFTMSQFRDAADMAGACVETAHNALHPTAAQEEGNGFWPEMTKSGGPDWTGFDG